MTPIGISILQTLKYSDHFGFPLTLSEIHSRLVGARSSRPLLITAINQMLKSKTISQTGDYYHLPGHASLVARRLKRAKFCAPRLRLAQTLAIKLSHTPGILAIYLTGSLAMSNSSVNDDIDFMIIAHSHHLWTTRFLLTLYTTILGLRRTPNSPRSSGKLCLNLYLTPMSYALPNHKQSLYTAYELVQAIPLFDPHNTRASLLAANPWIRHYLPNATQATRTVPKRNSRLQVEKGSPAGEGTVLMVLIEKLLYRLQLLYMRPKLTREYVTQDSAFFHPHDPGTKVLRGLSLKGIPGCKPSRARRQAKGESSLEV